MSSWSIDQKPLYSVHKENANGMKNDQSWGFMYHAYLKLWLLFFFIYFFFLESECKRHGVGVGREEVEGES